MEDTEVDIAKVRALYESDPLAERILEKFAERKRAPRGGITTSRLIWQWFKDDGFTNREINKVLRELADAGAGEFILGRRGGHTRICWSTPVIGLARAVIDGESEIEEVEYEEEAFEEDIDGNDLPARLMIRPGLTVEILGLPQDLTQKEAEKITEFVRILPLTQAPRESTPTFPPKGELLAPPYTAAAK
ncbi:MAG: hypothetical protein JKY56_12920 [Kofleriaceae bacterium]|nr:hypothetical protein [Kofleriaceae bacterium]